ncbi:MAG: isoprenylcysteine carboxylmethyltransferase family protein [Planctomycetia bacterium]|nr:isoprenylcysteine carboxylmethyltransferase family protein [Planctomycetia bacterium]MCC7315953.1 isoprenylcysteine carboxylmethyltransferase family protein [Planctomycetota bacterium]OQZ06806.1 MAG: hypothetical protein B6D36_03145 [Planctomycetes bacterium UTPLA1]
MKRLWILLFPTIFGLILFISAGRIDLPFFWITLAVLTLTMSLGMGGIDADLMKERKRPGPGGVDRMLRWRAMPFMLAQLIVAGLDAGRFNWSGEFPPWLQALGVMICCTGMLISGWAMRVNRFFSPVVRIQSERGHHLITDGPYRLIRHPGYLGTLLGSPGMSIALGSWWSMLALIPLSMLLFRRLLIEDRYLKEHLDGYAQYAERVRFRLIPGIW